MVLVQIGVRNQADQTALVNLLVNQGWKPDPTTPPGTETVILLPATTPVSKQVAATQLKMDPAAPNGAPIQKLAIKNLKL